MLHRRAPCGGPATDGRRSRLSVSSGSRAADRRQAVIGHEATSAGNGVWTFRRRLRPGSGHSNRGDGDRSIGLCRHSGIGTRQVPGPQHTVERNRVRAGSAMGYRVRQRAQKSAANTLLFAAGPNEEADGVGGRID
jgi:hypothetical protein